ncbi:uncharacterized protein A1O5_09993 [Cladophialophora psammophila CBS 110553]|uniref:Uncharacterized protein n=1 Tax=Cladophialophora psammophila CBS 110553 TaxID=1182543 RepID=W9WFS6_9EURO|nr:uncharacterized protein A1O5_09993 [Cladophialophora psammophila CBS 110553]EXJ66798.1 hypothetical protein A1O5_09993 [Cladophialophora psammophila CBS 110553]
MAAVTWNGTQEDLYQKNESVVLPSSWSDIYSLSASTNLLCVAQYGLRKAEVTYMTDQTTGTRQVQVHELDPTFLRSLEGLTSETLSNAILDSVSASGLVVSALYPNPNANVIVVNGPSGSEAGYFPTNADAFFTIMTQRYPPVNGSIMSTWFDPEFLQNASSEFLTSVAAQFASRYLRDTNNTVLGTAEVIEPRSVVLSAVFYAIEALLGLFTLAALALAWPASKSVTPIDPDSIGGTTALLCSDGELTDRFRGTGSYTLSDLRSHLLGDDQANKRMDTSRPHNFGRKIKFRDGHSADDRNAGGLSYSDPSFARLSWSSPFLQMPPWR